MHEFTKMHAGALCADALYCHPNSRSQIPYKRLLFLFYDLERL